MTWAGGRRLMTANNGTHSLAFHYDDKGIRTSKTANGVTTSYTSIDGRITGQYNGTDRLYFRYDNGNKLTGLRWNSDEYLYVNNPQGDITEILDMIGNIVVQYSYDAWGNVLTTTGPMAGTLGQLNPFCYRGYCLDTETGLYYLQSRYYDPTTGRFINADEPEMLTENVSIPICANLYAYCGNHPINMIDVNGHKPDYITSQNVDVIVDIFGSQVPMSEVKWGLLGDISKNGCGVIAAYNVLLSMNPKMNFGKVRNELWLLGGPLALGKLGVDPAALVKYMRLKFWLVTTAGPVTNFWGFKAEFSDSVIILFKWNNSATMHYIAGIGTENNHNSTHGDFRFYNTGLKGANLESINGKAMSVVKLLDVLKMKGCTPLLFIGVNGKKGWW